MKPRAHIRLGPAMLAAAGALALAATELPAAPPTFGSIHLSTGVRLHYAEQGASAGEPIILLHGYGDSWFSFSRALPFIPDRYRVYSLSLRGHGDSDRPGSGYRMSDLAADVLAFMDAKGIVRASLVGHSMGSFVAQQVALAAPRRVTRLVLVGSATTPRAFGGMQDLERMVDSLPDPVPIDFAREFQVSTIHQPVPDEFMRTVVAESLQLPARVWREVMRGMMATERPVASGRAGIPTLLLRGDRDAFAVAAEQDSLVAMLRTARAKTYRDVGHTPHWEQPERFARDVVAFLDGQ